MITPVPNAVLVSAATTSTMTHHLTVRKQQSPNASRSADGHEMPIRRFKLEVANCCLENSPASLLGSGLYGARTGESAAHPGLN
jgi:hypothetical protein